MVRAQARFALDLSPLDAVLNGFRLRHQADSWWAMSAWRLMLSIR
ncbi:hypothetical protein ACFO0J_09045 [Castellaniella hirudinis]|uniref:Uncharacterized protein n=1 Tax=Castellaniella hirudinis TaxID=1144617 RepID=A0ABV8RYC6_9BURK